MNRLRRNWQALASIGIFLFVMALTCHIPAYNCGHGVTCDGSITIGAER